MQKSLERKFDGDGIVAGFGRSGMISNLFQCFPESVQKSLERKFGRNGGKVPITPSEEFEKRIAVSIFQDIFALRACVMLKSKRLTLGSEFPGSKLTRAFFP